MPKILAQPPPLADGGGIADHVHLMETSPELLESLRSLIGRQVDWRGQRCEIIEVLVQGPVLVLRSVERARPIQGNHHGEAGQRAPETFEVNVLGTDGTPHPDFIALTDYPD